ncbi:MAG: NUDIX domain-containing protein [Candidatus Baltobacteraceae bacterium]
MGTTRRIHLATSLVVRDGNVLLVASRYSSHREPLWNLPGGRQRDGELLEETALRELHEETGLRGEVRDFAYLAESYDGERHFLSAAFCVDDAGGEIRIPTDGDHVVGAQWVEKNALAERLTVAVVREPLLRYLREGCRYSSFPRADVSVRWFDESPTSEC